MALQNHTDGPLTDFRGKTRIFSYPVYLSLKEFSLQDFRGGSLRFYPGKQFVYHRLYFSEFFPHKVVCER
ncbi:hypothetical protein E4I37_21255 [Escherichia coli]|nr:hypothetical protein [Escherichia coli]